MTAVLVVSNRGEPRSYLPSDEVVDWAVDYADPGDWWWELADATPEPPAPPEASPWEDIPEGSPVVTGTMVVHADAVWVCIADHDRGGLGPDGDPEHWEQWQPEPAPAVEAGDRVLVVMCPTGTADREAGTRMARMGWNLERFGTDGWDGDEARPTFAEPLEAGGWSARFVGGVLQI